jgi:hypothetical protein
MELAAPGNGCSTNALVMCRILVTACFLAVVPLLQAESWPEVLARMPLRGHVTYLNRTNCAEILLPAFQSNTTVKAIIFMPGSTDELYFFRRAQAVLTNQNPTLLDALVALTNQTHIRVVFKPPFVLLHSEEDVLDLQIDLQHAPTKEKLQKKDTRQHWVFYDQDWDALRKTIKGQISPIIWPGPYANESRHFYRNTFSTWNLTGWETLEAAAYAARARIIVRRHSVVFEPDERVGALPKLEGFPAR